MVGPMHSGQGMPMDWIGWGMWVGPTLAIAFWVVLVVSIVWLTIEVRRFRISASRRS